MSDEKQPTSPTADAGTAPCDPLLQSCGGPPVVHAVLQVKEITFGGNHVVEKDTAGPFVAPEWVRGRAAADNAPVCYARNTTMTITAKLDVTQKPSAADAVDVRGRATLGPAQLEWNGSVTVNPGDSEVSVAGMVSTGTLPNRVTFFDPGSIDWESNAAMTGWKSAGRTSHTIYVVLGAPTGTAHWTLLDISCRGADGKTTEDDFVRASFLPFQSTIGDGKGFKRKRDGVELTYYKQGAGTPSSGVFTCADLLSRADGTGRCGAWARFLVAMHQAHGVTSSAVFGVVPVDAQLLIVKNCTFGAGTQPVPFTHRGQSECVKQQGIVGQGKNNPQFTFGDHALVRHSTGIYDPSYGVGPKANLLAWEGGGIAGIGAMPLLPFMFGGDRHIIPALCSPGFIKYTAVAGDTMASIATKFGIASGGALYNHAYNAAFRALRAAPGNPQPGDVVFIPRDIATTLAILK